MDRLASPERVRIDQHRRVAAERLVLDQQHVLLLHAVVVRAEPVPPVVARQPAVRATDGEVEQRPDRGRIGQLVEVLTRHGCLGGQPVDDLGVVGVLEPAVTVRDGRAEVVVDNLDGSRGR